MVTFAWIYNVRIYHTKGQCWNSKAMRDDETYLLSGKRAYFYDCASDPGKFLYCEDCLREMGVLW